MAGARRGHTTQEEQLELTWSVPPATPATTDFVCWLWAAFPAKNDRLDVSRVARALEISPTTLRRWIAKDNPKLRHQQVAKVHQRAILRGRGHYLWPELDPTTRRRSELQYATAVRNAALIATEPERISPAWQNNGTLDPHEVHIVHWHKAHAYGVAMTTHDKALARVHRHGTVLESTTVENKYAAIVLKHEILARLDEHRCITPRHLVPTGRTETWREAGGPTTIRRPLEVNLVRFAGLSYFDRIEQRLRTDLPAIHLTVQQANSAEEACAALAQPADVTILSTHGYTRSTWHGATPWPGGRWYAGHKTRAGMSLDQLARGVEEHGGLLSSLLIIDTCQAGQTRAKLRRLANDQTRLLFKTKDNNPERELDDLIDLVRAVGVSNRDDHSDWAAGTRHYRR